MVGLRGLPTSGIRVWGAVAAATRFRRLAETNFNFRLISACIITGLRWMFQPLNCRAGASPADEPGK
jgi:hypothetical protein